MRISYALALAAMCTATPSLSATVFLDCELDTNSGKQLWKISVNADAGTVSFEHADGSGTEQATFTPDQVVWLHGWLKINRITLEFERNIGTFDKDGPQKGRCKLSATKRAF